MGLPITVPVLWDANDQYFNGALLTIDSEALVIQQALKPAGPFVIPYNNPVLVTTLLVKDKIQGGLYLNLTWLGWQALVRAASGSPGPKLLQKTYNITLVLQEGTTIVDPALIGATLETVAKSGVSLDPTGVLDNTTGTLTIASGLVTGDWVSITYYIN